MSSAEEPTIPQIRSRVLVAVTERTRNDRVAPALGEARYVGVHIVVPKGEYDMASGDRGALMVSHPKGTVTVATHVHDSLMTQLGALVAINLLPGHAPDLGGRQAIEPEEVVHAVGGGVARRS